MSSGFIFDIVMVALVIFLVSFILRLFKLPKVISYIFVGIILGPSVLNLIKNEDIIFNLGELGIILLLFFIGMEVSLPSIVTKWKVTIFGTIIQVVLSIFIAFISSFYFGWNLSTTILAGFLITLSSTAVILRILQDKKETNTKVGQNVIGILIVQDIAVVPMIIILNMLSGKGVSFSSILLNLIGALLLFSILAFTIFKKDFKVPLLDIIKKDHEIQIFLAFLLCFGMAALSALFGLSPAIGAFVGGVVIASMKETDWVSKSLHTSHIIFIALFFVYIGTLIDINYLFNNFSRIIMFVFGIFFVKTIFNLFIFRVLGDEWNESLYSGALLSQIGEFSFVLVAVGLENGLISKEGYSVVVILIALTLLLSSIWIWGVRKYTGIKCVGDVCTYRSYDN